MFGKLVGNFHFDAGASWNEGSLLDKGTHHTKSIMKGTLSLVNHKLVGASQQNGDSLAFVGATGNFDDFR